MIKIEWLRRAVRTFLQAVAGFISVNLVGFFAGVDYTSRDALKAAGISIAGSALAAGIAAIMNLKKEDN